MTKRLSDIVIDSFERLSLRADVVHVYSDDLRSMLEEIRASRKAASVVRDALNIIVMQRENFVEDAAANSVILAAETLADPNVISWMGGEV